ncbi:MAG: single-stranded-DNA-specific exonuclease RecJ [Anaeromyxobacteraceae bacterium]
MISRRRILRRDPRLDLQAALPSTLHPVLRRVYGARGIAKPADLELRLDHLLPVSSLGGVEQAAELLLRLHQMRGKVLIIGDFDADGATSTALMLRHLTRLGFATPDFLVPDRFRFGYGLTPEIVRVAAERKPDLIVTVDNGISSLEGVAEARRLGIDVLVTDHHLPGREVPEAVCIVNPNARGNTFASKMLAGVGVAFYVMAALTHAMRQHNLLPTGVDTSPAQWLDLVALGTVADVVPLTGVNRVLVRWGLEELARTRRVGLAALKRVAGIAPGAVTAGQVGFRLGPRINAAGRLDDAGRGVRLLLESDPTRAAALADELDRENRSRQEIEREILEQALAQAEERVRGGARGLVLSSERWHPGVIGIVASRVVERFHRPAVLVGVADGVGKGSGRSIEAFHLYDALDACAGHLTRFGGHKHAAGITIDPARIAAFREAFEGIASARLGDDDLVPRCRIEGRVAAADLSERAALALEGLAPWGAGHPEPLFALRARPGRARTVGATGAHLKLTLGAGLDAIGFGLGDRLAACEGEVEAAVSLGFEEWDGRRRLQLRIKDLRQAA